MSKPEHSDDPELRALLDSIGITEDDRTPPDLTAEEYERAERMLAHVLDRVGEPHPQPSEPATSRTWLRRRYRTLNLAVATGLCLVIGVVVLIVQPWAGTPPAAAQTPAMLRFAGVKAGQVEPRGDAAGGLLRQIADRAAVQPAPADLPVQYVELDAWWASTEPPEAGGEARTVLVPTVSRAYLLPSAERRAIEVRGKALDAGGHLSEIEPSWDAAPALSDTTTALDPDQGLGYLHQLPTDLTGLTEELAPAQTCGSTRGGCLLVNVAALFETYVVPPDIAARLWNALAREPSITSLGTTRDRLGRDAVVLTAPSVTPKQQILLLIDPGTGSYLGSETILVAPDESWGFDPPAVISFTALVKAQRIADSQVPDDSTTKRY